MMMERRYIVAGIGGQGVVFATKVLAQAGLARGVPVTACENHGMSQRGGSVMSHVRIGSKISPYPNRWIMPRLLGCVLRHASIWNVCAH